MLAALRKEYPNTGYMFTSQHGTPFTEDAVNRLIKDWLGHVSILAKALQRLLAGLIPHNRNPGSGHRGGIEPGFTALRGSGV
jgi:hypothetical protein